MRSKYLKIILLQLVIITQVTYSQSIIRSSLSCLGSTISENGYLIRQTIGQSSSTGVFNNEELFLRQGFQQPISSYNSLRALLPIDFTLSPNPAADKTLLEFKEEIPQYSMTVRNTSGIILLEFKDKSLQSRWLDFKNYPAGIYLITVTSDNRLAYKKLVVTH